MYHLYRTEGLIVGKKGRRKCASHRRCRWRWPQRQRNTGPWTFDTERLENGRYLRILTLIGQFTRGFLVLWAVSSLTEQEVVVCLQKLSGNRSFLLAITVDNGAEF